METNFSKIEGLLLEAKMQSEKIVPGKYTRANVLSRKALTLAQKEIQFLKKHITGLAKQSE